MGRLGWSEKSVQGRGVEVASSQEGSGGAGEGAGRSLELLYIERAGPVSQTGSPRQSGTGLRAAGLAGRRGGPLPAGRIPTRGDAPCSPPSHEPSPERKRLPCPVGINCERGLCGHVVLFEVPRNTRGFPVAQRDLCKERRNRRGLPPSVLCRACSTGLRWAPGTGATLGLSLDFVCCY